MAGIERRGASPWRSVLLAVCATVLCSAQAATAPRALLVDGGGPWRDVRWPLAVAEFTSLLTDAGYEVNTVSPGDLASTPLAPDVLLAIPSLESLPLASFKAIVRFLASGGTLMASGGEPFRDPLYLAADGKWRDRNALLQAVASQKTVLDPASVALTEGLRAPAHVTRTTVAGPDGRSRAAHFALRIPFTDQWYVLSAPITNPIFDAGQNATIVWTRGTPGQFMLFEWDEADGSRWIATVALGSQWSKQVLLPSDFHYLSGGTPTRAGTAFTPAHASGLFFGVSTSASAQPGPLEFAVSAIGVATAPVLESFSAPVVETLSPAYKQYETQRAGRTVRIPFARGRGLSATPDPDGRFRTIGDATWYSTNSGSTVIWLPWPQLRGRERAELIARLRAAPQRLHIMNAGPAHVLALPGENVVLGASIVNRSKSSAVAELAWSILDSNGAAVRKLTTRLSLAPGQLLRLTPAGVGSLPDGDYTVTAALFRDAAEVDRIDSRIRVFDPTLAFQPEQRIVVANGAFSTAGGRRLFLQGVNYWPRYAAALEPERFKQSWLLPENYDPDLIEADLSLLASLHFNLVSIKLESLEGSRALVDFLDRCRKHGIWANIYIPAFVRSAREGILYYDRLLTANRDIGSILKAAFLPGNDRVFAYDLLWEPQLGGHSNRAAWDSAWRAWIIEQYGSLGKAETAWRFTAPRDAQGELSNPLDEQIENDGPWRVMVAAYRRFIDDQVSRAFGAAARLIRSVSPGTLLSYRSGVGAAVDASKSLTPRGRAMLSNMIYDLSAAAAHLDFISPDAYEIPLVWPAGQGLGFVAAYARYRSGGKPVYWSEYGRTIEAEGRALATQGVVCDSVMRLIAGDGSGAAAAWWMPGGWRVDEQSDYGILNPDGTARPCAKALSQWATNFLNAPPRPPAGSPAVLTIDRDADARGDVAIFLNREKDYLKARQAGRPVVVRDPGTGTDTSTMPRLDVGNVPHNGSGPLKYANGEFAGIHIRCPGIDVTAENGAQVEVPAGSSCQITPALMNTGSATWAGVVLHTNLGDLPLGNSVRYLQRTNLGPLQVSVHQSNIDIAGRLSIQGVGPFGEILHLTLVSAGAEPQALRFE